MNTNVFRLLLLGSLFSLSACVQQSEVRQMKHSADESPNDFGKNH